MNSSWTEVQRHRLKELNGAEKDLETAFGDDLQRNRAFQKLEKQLVYQERKRLDRLLDTRFRPLRCELESLLIDALKCEGFTRVETPTIISQNDLERMSIDRSHPFNDQVYRVDSKHCLRPMLAPGLYRLMKDLARIRSGKPVRIFEIGPCFRKETSGARHAGEFTMLNLVEMRIEKGSRRFRIETLAKRIMHAAGIDTYDLVDEPSEVYNTTLDIVCGSDPLEVASCAMGPHPLDAAWGIIDTWVGLGFGLERLLMARENSPGIGKWCKSVSYLDGIRLTL
ncbi:MAG: pyrrolysine--tRNA(Pyl) ligase large subunit [Deltaproteobacteria bacterium]|nr:MAG: pyrrolysine--tRNA(Pyl) ligase large subunit [Deltaproteobacteria bacterium]